MAYIDFVTKLHQRATRDYLGRVNAHDKAACAEIARQWGRDYWDGERHLGYGGYRYDGRWRTVAEDMVRHYGLKSGDRILDVGCGKAFLLYEFTQVVPGIAVAGIDISDYAIEHAKEEVKPFLKVATASALPYEDRSFDFVFSVNSLHNLQNFELFAALKEIERVGRSGRAHITIESFRNEREKMNLLYWQLTCESFHRPAAWEWMFAQAGYRGDYGCIFFE